MAKRRRADDIVTKTIAERIRQRRAELNLSQEQLGELSGLHRTYVGSVERGEKHISVVTLQRIADALKMPLVYFLAR
jgi:transcriptional regulator with XRE-family HTH domain